MSEVKKTRMRNEVIKIIKIMDDTLALKQESLAALLGITF